MRNILFSVKFCFTLKVIYDCDPGIDDAFGLQFLLNHDNVEILAITT